MLKTTGGTCKHGCDYNYLDVFHQELVNEFGERDSGTSILIQAVEIAADIAMTEYMHDGDGHPAWNKIHSSSYN